MVEIVAENYLCLYALIEMVLKDNGYNEFDQYSLADYFGIAVPLNYSIGKVTNVSYTSEKRKWGTCINTEDINQFFDKNNIRLKAKYIAANPFNEYDEVEILSAKDYTYIIYMYSYGTLNHELVNWEIGHTALFMGFEDTCKVKIYDPGPRNAGLKELSINSLYDAIYDSQGGILIIERK